MPLCYAAAVRCLTVLYVLNLWLLALLASNWVSYLIVAVGCGSIELDLLDD